MIEQYFRGPLRGPEAKPDFLRETEDRQALLTTLHKLRVQDVEILDFLAQTRFDEIQRILSSHLRKSIADQDSVAHIVPKVKLILLKLDAIREIGMKQSAPMGYLSTDDLIVANVELLRDRYRYFKGPFSLYLLWMLYHEEGHAAASHYLQSSRSGHSVSQVGLEQQRHQKGEKQPRSLYYVISEGVNDKLARQNTVEHVLANPIKGVTHADLKALQNIYSASGPILHISAIHLVDALVNDFSEGEKLPAETIWGALIHAQMNGLDLGDSKIRALLDSELGGKSSSELAHMTLDKIPEFLQKYDLTYRIEDFFRAALERARKDENESE